MVGLRRESSPFERNESLLSNGRHIRRHLLVIRPRLIDDSEVSREIDDPFHILLLDATFLDAPRITIQYVASSCAYVLGMPYDESAELAAHAKAEGFSCLGTWGHEECLRLATQLQQRDLVCRVVPFCEGGDRAWQARNAEEGAGMKRAEEDAR
jgi:hypothetical protein